MTAGHNPVLRGALDAALNSRDPMDARDGAAIALARVYADAIDADSARLAVLGPQLTAVLVELGMTPKARAAIVGKGTGASGAPKGKSALDELRERREQRTR